MTLIILCSCASGTKNINSPPDSNPPRDVPEDIENTPPVNAPAPPVLYLKASGNFSQETSFFNIFGQVFDQDNLAFADAEVSILNLDNNNQAEVLTDEEGFFSSNIRSNEGDDIVIQARDPESGTLSNEVRLKVIGTALGQIYQLDQMAVFKTNNQTYFFLTQENESHIQIFKRNRNQLDYIATYGRRGRGKDSFALIKDICMNQAGQLFVADPLNARIVALQFDNEQLTYLSDSKKDSFYEIFSLINPHDNLQFKLTCHNDQVIAFDQRKRSLSFFSFRDNKFYYHGESSALDQAHYSFVKDMSLSERILLVSSSNQQNEDLHQIFTFDDIQLFERINFINPLIQNSRLWNNKLISFRKRAPHEIEVRQDRFRVRGIEFEKRKIINFIPSDVDDYQIHETHLIDDEAFLILKSENQRSILSLHLNNDNLVNHYELLRENQDGLNLIKNIQDFDISENGEIVFIKNKPYSIIAINNTAETDIIDHLELSDLGLENQEDMASIATFGNTIFISNTNRILTIELVNSNLVYRDQIEIESQHLTVNEEGFLVSAVRNELSLFKYTESHQLELLETINTEKVISDLSISGQRLLISFEGSISFDFTQFLNFEGVSSKLYRINNEQLDPIRSFEGLEASLFVHPPSQFAFNKNIIYQANAWNNRVSIMQLSEQNTIEPLFAFGNYGYLYGQFNSSEKKSPYAIKVKNKLLYVLDAYRIQIFPILTSNNPEESLLEDLIIELNNEIFYDQDNDYVYDSSDNCPEHFNPDQIDQDNDGLGDICDETDNRLSGDDSDNDGLPDDFELSLNLNPNSDDSDNDGLTDAQELGDNSFQIKDHDFDGIIDALEGHSVVGNSENRFGNISQIIKHPDRENFYLIDNYQYYRLLKLDSNGNILHSFLWERPLLSASLNENGHLYLLSKRTGLNNQNDRLLFILDENLEILREVNLNEIIPVNRPDRFFKIKNLADNNLLIQYKENNRTTVFLRLNSVFEVIQNFRHLSDNNLNLIDIFYDEPSDSIYVIKERSLEIFDRDDNLRFSIDENNRGNIFNNIKQVSINENEIIIFHQDANESLTLRFFNNQGIETRSINLDNEIFNNCNPLYHGLQNNKAFFSFDCDNSFDHSLATFNTVEQSFSFLSEENPDESSFFCGENQCDLSLDQNGFLYLFIKNQNILKIYNPDGSFERNIDLSLIIQDSILSLKRIQSHYYLITRNRAQTSLIQLNNNFNLVRVMQNPDDFDPLTEIREDDRGRIFIKSENQNYFINRQDELELTEDYPRNRQHMRALGDLFMLEMTNRMNILMPDSYSGYHMSLTDLNAISTKGLIITLFRAGHLIYYDMPLNDLPHFIHSIQLSHLVESYHHSETWSVIHKNNQTYVLSRYQIFILE